MNSFEDALGQLPKPILDKLQSMIRRVRRLLFIRGLFATLAVALVSLLAIMAVDAAITLFSTTARWVLSLAALAATLTAAWWFLVRPLSRRFTLTRMARILEIRHPELQERISTAVELLSSNDPDSIRGSEELISAVVDSAVVDVETVDPRTEFKPARAKKFVLAAGICVSVILLLLAIWPTQSWTLLARAIAPFLDIGNAYADTIQVDPGNIRVAKGDPVTIEVSVKHKRLKRAEIRRQLPDGSEAVERMSLIAEEADGTKRFSLTFPSVEEDFNYRVRAGAALSQYFDVTTVEPPAVENITIRYDFPAYTGLTPVEGLTETGEIRAVAHTRVSISADLKEQAWTSRMVLNESSEVPDPISEEKRTTWNFELKAGMNGSWHLEFTDEEGFASHPVTYPIEVLPDKAPTVQITQPLQRELRLKPTERLPIDFDLIEDFGFSDVMLLVTPDGAQTPVEVLQDNPTATAKAGHFFSRAVLDIPALKLAPEQQRLSVQVQARDNRPSDYDGPGTGMSEVIFVTLDENAASLADQAIEQQRREINEQINDAKKELERARDDMRRTEQELNRSEEMNEKATERLSEFTEHNQAAREKLDEVAATLNNPLFQEQSADAQRISNETLAEAQDSADMIPVTDGRRERVGEAQESREKVEEAIRDLDDLARSMRDAQEDYEAISKLNELANRQQELAMKSEDWAERARQEAAAMARESASEEAQNQFNQQQRQETEQFRSEQSRVEEQLGEMLKDNASALAEVLEQQREQSENLSQQAQALADQQQALKDASSEATETSERPEDVLREALIDQLAARQSQLAEETDTALETAKEAAAAKADPDPDTGKDAPTESKESSTPETLAQAAANTAQAAKELEKRNLNEAASSANEAMNSLADAASQQSSPPEPPETSSTPMPQAESSAAPAKPEIPLPGILSDLAMRQETIAKQIDAISKGDLQEALSMMESQLDAEVQSLEAQAQGLEQSLGNLEQNQARSQTDQAGKSLERGADEAAESAKQLAKAQEQQTAATESGDTAEGELSQQAKSSMQQGQKNQQQSADSLSQAAKALAQSAESIGQTMEGLEPSDMDERLTNSEDLAKGFEEVSQSSQSSNAEQAASQSQEAANSLQQLARAAMQKLGAPPQGPPGGQDPPQGNPEMSGEPDSTDLNESGQKTADANGSGVPPELQNLGISAEDWSRFKGALVGGNAAAIESDLPVEYRELVGRYFQVIAKEAGKTE